MCGYRLVAGYYTHQHRPLMKINESCRKIDERCRKEIEIDEGAMVNRIIINN